jgi:cell division protein FtsA
MVDGWVVGSLAAGEIVLTETEREMGVVVCDVGGGTCDLAVYIEGAVWHTGVIPVGGDHLTNDIAQGLHLPAETAEAVKIRHGLAKRSMTDEAQAFAVRPFGQDGTVNIRRANLAAIIEPRVEELFSLVRQEIKRSGYDGLLPAGLVLTGGTSLLPGIREMASDVLQLPVRTAGPEEIRGLVDKLQSPAYSASLGLLEWARLQEEEGMLDGRYNGHFSLANFNLSQAVEMFRRLLPG